MKMKSKCVFIILAGGTSSRMGGQKKELLPLATSHNAITLLTQTLNKIPFIKHMHVVYAPDYQDLTQASVADYQGVCSFSPAGSSRQDSVRIALEYLLSYDPSWVMIHDGARPWLEASLIERLYQALGEHEAVLPIIPVTDSLKRLDRNQRVIEECHREEYGLAQTPQAFHFKVIYEAHHALHGAMYSDDTSLYHAYHHRHAQSIRGDISNKKLTYKEDLL